VSEKTQKQREWPKNGSALSNKLRRLAPNLRAAGVDIEFNTEGHKKTRKISLEWRGNSPSAPSADEETEQNQQLSADAAPAASGHDDEQTSDRSNLSDVNTLPHTADGADAADGEKQDCSDESPKRNGWAIWHNRDYDAAVNVTGWGERDGQWFALTDTGCGVPASEIEFVDEENRP
jgi:hypothetical protein